LLEAEIKVATGDVIAVKRLVVAVVTVLIRGSNRCREFDRVLEYSACSHSILMCYHYLPLMALAIFRISYNFIFFPQKITKQNLEMKNLSYLPYTK